MPRHSAMTPAQRTKLQVLCARYEVEYREGDYFVNSMGSAFMPGWVEGWVGGSEHATADRGGTEKPTLFVGVSPEGDSHS